MNSVSNKVVYRNSDARLLINEFPPQSLGDDRESKLGSSVHGGNKCYFRNVMAGHAETKICLLFTIIAYTQVDLPCSVCH